MTPAPTPPQPVGSCVAHSVLTCINSASSFWPACDPGQAKNNAGPSGYEFGKYCTQEWADALNEVLSLPEVNICDDADTIHEFLAQVAYETGYYSTVYQPRDGGAGLIHMIPANWQVNARDMDELWPGNDYAGKVAAMGKDFFQTAAYGWRSVAAWYLRTNRVIGGCGKNLFEESYQEQTRCILSRVVDRSEAFSIVGGCLPQTQPTPTPAPAPGTPSPMPTPQPGGGSGWQQWQGAGITYHGPAYDVATYCPASPSKPIGNACWRLDNDPTFKEDELAPFCSRQDLIAFGHPAAVECGECTEIRVQRLDGTYNTITVMTTDNPGSGGTTSSPELSTAGKEHLTQGTGKQLGDRLPFEWRLVDCV